jgi:hypothetical protein
VRLDLDTSWFEAHEGKSHRAREHAPRLRGHL